MNHNTPFRDAQARGWTHGSTGQWAPYVSTPPTSSHFDVPGSNTYVSDRSSDEAPSDCKYGCTLLPEPIAAYRCPDAGSLLASVKTACAASSSTRPINPEEIPLPQDHPDDFPPPDKILAKVARPASKAGGARHSAPSGKGKAKATDDIEIGGSLNRKRKRTSKGRSSGQRGWALVTELFNEQASAAGRPTRLAKSLETKFKQLVRTTKPTGDAELLPHVEEALEIEDLMNEKAGTRDLDDDEYMPNDDDDDDADLGGDSDKENDPVAKKVKTKSSEGPVAHCQVTKCRTAASNSQNFVDTLSAVLDPAVQAARQEEQSSRTLQATSMLTLSRQLREAQRTIDTLRQRLDESQRELMRVESRADRAEMRLEMNSLQHSNHHQRSPSPAHLWTTTVIVLALHVLLAVTLLSTTTIVILALLAVALLSTTTIILIAAL
ncbi:hypothetical protein EV360DRAFT_72445 [Lentinula raphanica]|nr:hypothetical protein EV360DRAFT_72445 [Lentinula raphanica]